MRWDSDLLVPVLYSRMDVKNLLGDTSVVESPDQSLSLKIEEEMELLNPDKVIVVHDTLSEELFNIPLYLQYAPGQQLIDKQSYVTMQLDDMELDLVKARVATMKFYVTNTVQQPLRVRYEMLSSDKDGSTFETYENVPAATASGPSYSVKSIHLDGYTIDMTGVSGNEVNTVVSRTQVWLHPDADSIWITPQDSVFIVSTFDELKVDYVHGYFGKQNYDGSGSAPLDLFKSVKSGTFDLDHVKGHLEVTNYTGMDVQLSLDKLATYKSSTGQEILLNDPIIGQTINLSRAKENAYGLDNVVPRTKTFELDKNNLDQMIEQLADSLRFKISGVINPLGNVSGGNDFMYFEKAIIARLALEIPLNLSANNLMIEDTAQLNLEKDKNLKSGRLVIYVDNMFPFDLEMQFYVLDEDGQIVDSIITTNTTIASAQIDGNGFAIFPSKTVLEADLSPDKVAVLNKYKDVLIRSRMSTYQNKKYQIYSNYYLDVRVVADVKYEL